MFHSLFLELHSQAATREGIYDNELSTKLLTQLRPCPKLGHYHKALTGLPFSEALRFCVVVSPNSAEEKSGDRIETTCFILDKLIQNQIFFP